MNTLSSNRSVLAFSYVQLNLHVLDIVLDIGKSVQNLFKIVQNLPLIVQLPNTGLQPVVPLNDFVNQADNKKERDSRTVKVLDIPLGFSQDSIHAAMSRYG